MNARALRGAFCAAAFTLFGGASCGGRTLVGSLPGPPECTRDRDCEGFDDRCRPVRCVAETCTEQPPPDCDDRNPCTLDLCDPGTGRCAFEPATLDLDQDRHRAPLPGKRAGEIDSCGDDCDDTNASAFPGGREVCDGVDNDCNGVVDDGASIGSIRDAVQVSEGDTSEPSSLAFAGGVYTAAYSGRTAESRSVYLAQLARGGRVTPRTKFTTVAADASGARLVWTGDRFGIAWIDRREARADVPNYEVYFNLANPDGSKRMADLRVSRADGFSLDVALAWTSREFVALWQDDGTNSFQVAEVVGQRIDVNGALIGEPVRLVNEAPRAQLTPAIAAGRQSLGVVWVRVTFGTGLREVMFAPFDHELRPLAAPVAVSGRMPEGVYPVIAYLDRQYVITWYDPNTAVMKVFGAIRGELGEEIVAAKSITQAPNHARYPALLAYGNRILLVWSDDRDGNGGYELYAKTLDQKLEPLTPETRLTNSPGHSIDPTLSFGPDGDVGILFGDDRSGALHAYFTSLSCVPAQTLP